MDGEFRVIQRTVVVYMTKINQEFLKSLRSELNLSQRDVAFALGVGRTTYTKIENGTQDIDTELLVKLASFFKVSVDSLLGIPPNSNYTFDLQQFGDSEYKSASTLDNKISFKVASFLRSANNADKELLLHFLESDSETKKALAQIIALTLKK